MMMIQILIGVLAAIGVGCILADLMKVPTMKASKAANNLGKKDLLIKVKPKNEKSQNNF